MPWLISFTTLSVIGLRRDGSLENKENSGTFQAKKNRNSFLKIVAQEIMPNDDLELEIEYSSV